MHHHTPRWLVFAVGAGAVLCLAAVVDFVTRQTGLALTLVVTVYVLTRKHLPLSYTCAALDRLHHAAANAAAQFVPVLWLAFLAVGTWQHRSAGPAPAFASTLIVLYLIDRVTGFVIRRATQAIQRHQLRRRRRDAEERAAQQPVADVVGEVTR